MRTQPVTNPQLLDYRVTVLLCVAAALLSVRRFSGADLEMLIVSYDSWPREPWRLLTSCLLHGSYLHLLFNLYWTWRFGAIVEPALGVVATLGLYLFLGATSSAAGWAFEGRGVGLSGIGYGLFGFLWMLDRRHPGYRGVMSERTTQLFVIWFFICLIGTYLGAIPIGNAAHASGAIFGALIGAAVTPLGMKRLHARGLIAGLTVAIGLASTVGRIYVNPEERAYRSWERLTAGYERLNDGAEEEAARLLEEAVEIDPDSAAAWYYLGVAWEKLGRDVEAVEAYRRCEELLPERDSERFTPKPGGSIEGLFRDD